MSITCVYMLSDPRDFSPKYVGATKDLKVRLQYYRSNNPHSKPLVKWFNELRLLGLEPAVTILEMCTGEDLVVKELTHYLKLVAAGHKLLNHKQIMQQAFNKIAGEENRRV